MFVRGYSHSKRLPLHTNSPIQFHFSMNQFYCVLPEKVSACLVLLPQQPFYSSKLVFKTLRRPKGPPLRLYPHKQIYLSGTMLLLIMNFFPSSFLFCICPIHTYTMTSNPRYFLCSTWAPLFWSAYLLWTSTYDLSLFLFLDVSLSFLLLCKHSADDQLIIS